MSAVILPLRPANREAAARLVADIPEPIGGFDQAARDLLIADLPFILAGALSMILFDFDYEANQDASLALACRILAGTINRLEG
jgi:hypothetical protein